VTQIAPNHWRVLTSDTTADFRGEHAELAAKTFRAGWWKVMVSTKENLLRTIPVITDQSLIDALDDL
jgi:hypothetical protein